MKTANQGVDAMGGISPHIAKREGFTEPESADIAAYPPERRTELVENTLKQAADRTA